MTMGTNMCVHMYVYMHIAVDKWIGVDTYIYACAYMFFLISYFNFIL